MVPGMVGMRRSDDYAKGKASLFRFSNVCFDSIESMNLVGTICTGCKAWDWIDLRGAQAEVFLA